MIPRTRPHSDHFVFLRAICRPCGQIAKSHHDGDTSAARNVTKRLKRFIGMAYPGICSTSRCL
jgi:hypothetical protein